MQKLRGRVEEVEGHLCWFDKANTCHRLIDMEDSYLVNCVLLLEARKEKIKDFNQQEDIRFLEAECAYRDEVRKTSVGTLLYG